MLAMARYHRSAKFEKHSWANYSISPAEVGSYYKDDSIIVWTSQIAQAYLEAFEQSRGPVVSRYRDPALAIGSCRCPASGPIAANV